MKQVWEASLSHKETVPEKVKKSSPKNSAEKKREQFWIRDPDPDRFEGD